MKKHAPKLCCGGLSMLALCWLLGFAGELRADEASPSFWRLMDSVVESVSHGNCVLSRLNGIGFPSKERKTAAYRDFAIYVSNHCDEVYGSFSAYATNDLQACMLMSAGWAFDDAYYLRCYSNLVSAAERASISPIQLKWYAVGSCNEHRMNLLGLQYDQPGVSNLVTRVMRITGETNYLNRVLRGEAKQSYLEYINDIQHER